MRLHKFLLTAMAVAAFAIPTTSANADLVEIALINTAGGTGALLDTDPNTRLSDGLTVLVPEAQTEFPGLTLTVSGTTDVATGGTFNGTGGTFGINSDGGDDPQRLDGDLNEALTFTFSERVLITQVDFASGGDDVEISITDALGTFVIPSGNVVNFDGLDGNPRTLLSTPDTGVTFLAVSTSPIPAGGRVSPDFGFQDLTIARVPEPSSLAVLGLLSGVAMVRRRR